MLTKSKIKQLIAAYINLKEVYEANLSEEQLTNVRNVMYDFSSFVDDVINDLGDDDDDDYNSSDSSDNDSTVEDNGLYILNDETGEMEKYDWNYIDNISEEQNSNPANNNNDDSYYDGDEFDFYYDKINRYKNKINFN